MGKETGFGEKSYRYKLCSDGLCSFRVVLRETDLLIVSDTNQREAAFRAAEEARAQIIKYAKNNQRFFDSLVPVEISDSAPAIIKNMYMDTVRFKIGPMAAVAGAIADYVGRKLMPKTNRLIVENGGDVFLWGAGSVDVMILAGNNCLSGIKIRIEVGNSVRGIATSSSAIGHSLSLGSCDAATVLANSACLADAAATHLGNKIKGPDNIENEVSEIIKEEGVIGALAIAGDLLAACGDMEIVCI